MEEVRPRKNRLFETPSGLLQHLSYIYLQYLYLYFQFFLNSVTNERVSLTIRRNYKVHLANSLFIDEN